MLKPKMQTEQFSNKVPSHFGRCFHYNRVFYTKFEDEPAMVEEYVPGNFLKYINNNGECCSAPEKCSNEHKELFLKAECLVHYSYEYSKHKLMLLDTQGSKYQLYDPEIATTNFVCESSSEFLFCYGNLSTVAISEFTKKHTAFVVTIVKCWNCLQWFISLTKEKTIPLMKW